MSTETIINQPQRGNPFQHVRSYSASAVELMRALGAHRRATQQETLSPAQVLQVVNSLGYYPPQQDNRPAYQEPHRFVQAMSEFQKRYQILYPTAEHLLQVLQRLGYSRSFEEDITVEDADVAEALSGLPIDRRRHEPDARGETQERRANPEPGPQEQLELMAEEHLFLDALKDLREKTDREFASSEELLSILWNLDYRPLSEEGFPVSWLDEEQRCRMQMAFTKAVEKWLQAAVDTDYLTCRDILRIAADIGFRKS
jgi:hypothetical protein